MRSCQILGMESQQRCFTGTARLQAGTELRAKLRPVAWDEYKAGVQVTVDTYSGLFRASAHTSQAKASDGKCGLAFTRHRS